MRRDRIKQTWDIHVGAVDVIPRGEVPAFLAIRRRALLSRPRLVSPGKEHDEEFVDDVGVGDVKVVLQSRDVDIATNLESWLVAKGPGGARADATAYILLDVFLAVLERRLAKLGRDLGGGIIHKLAVGAKDVAGAGAALLLIGIAAVALRLRGARRRGRGPELRHRRYVLRHGMVQRGRLPVVGSLHGEVRVVCRVPRGVGGRKWETRGEMRLWPEVDVEDMWSRWQVVWRCLPLAGSFAT